MLTYPAKAVAAVSYRADRDTRLELAENSVVSERDYMSAFSTRVRDAWNAFGPAYAYSKTLPGDVEQALGCDTLVMIHDDHGAKICLLEAKWPRVVDKPSYRWDKLQKVKGTSHRRSHFSDQLQRQRSALPEAVVAEMFLLESPPGTKSSLLDEFGSTLVLHNDAYAFDSLHRQATVPWSNRDFWELVGFARRRVTNMKQLMLALASCQIGTPLPIAGGLVTFGVRGAANSIAIPTAVERLSQMGPELCERLGLTTILSLGVPWLGDA